MDFHRTTPSIWNILIAGLNNVGLLEEHEKIGFGIIGDTGSTVGVGETILVSLSNVDPFGCLTT